MNRLIIVSPWALVAVNTLFIIIATLGTIFRCRPIHKYWRPTELGVCANTEQYIFGVIGVTIATDVLASLIPA